MVTGPSLTSSTSMCSRKEPRFTDAPSVSRAAAKSSTLRAASSAGAAAAQDGRRPFRASPYKVNCGTTSTSPPTSASERFIFPSGSSKILRRKTLPPIHSAWAGPSPWPTATNTSKPGPISAAVLPPTRTEARDTRCTTSRMAGLIHPLSAEQLGKPNRMREDDRRQRQEGHTGKRSHRVASPADLLVEHQHGEGRHPPQVGHARGEHDQHERPAAAQAEQPMASPEIERPG